MRASTSERASGREANESDLFDYALIADQVGFVLRSALRHKGAFLGAFAAVFALALALMAVMPRQYQVESTILAQGGAWMMGTLSNPVINRAGDTPARAAREVVMRRENLVDLLKRTDFVERHRATRAPIAKARDWVLEKVTGRKPASDELLDLFADALAKKLWVVVSQEGTVTIAFVWSNPELAYEIVEAAVQSYLEARHAAEINVIQETIAILEEHDAAVRKEAAAFAKQLGAKERPARRQASRASSGVTQPRTVETDDDLPRLEGKYAARKRALADLEEFRRRRLDEVQAQLTQQMTVYAPQHPTIQATRRSIESLSTPSPQIEQLKAEVAELEQEITSRGGSVGALSAGGAHPAAEIEDMRVRMDDLDPMLDYERTQYRGLLRKHANLIDRIDTARMEMDTAQAAFKYRYSVITPPQIPRGPLKAYGLMLLAGGILGGVAFGLFVTTLLDMRGGRIVERWQVERDLLLPVLADDRHEG
jgi:uncharacterized protein involved in exopolysaccharide biosynthesis